VGGSNTADGNERAVLWKNGTMTDLGSIEDDNRSISASQINDSGEIVVHFAAFPNDRAFLWKNGTITDLGSLGGGYNLDYGYSSASRINKSGEIVGGSSTAGGFIHAFSWKNGTMTDLGTLGGNDSSANDINDSGEIVGNSSTADGKVRAFSWKNGTMTDLGTLGGNDSSANDINDSGEIVGNSSTADGNNRAFLWKNGIMTDLLPFSGLSSDISHINDAGQMLGRYEYYPLESGYGSFLGENGKAVDLSNLIAPNSGWYNLYGTKINNKGQIIGQGIFQGEYRAFFMNPTDQIIDPELITGLEPEPIPEPSTVIGSLLGLGTLATTARRRFKRSKAKSVIL
jgi:probable HAF family extracellular repeat protein